MVLQKKHHRQTEYQGPLQLDTESFRAVVAKLGSWGPQGSLTVSRGFPETAAKKTAVYSQKKNEWDVSLSEPLRSVVLFNVFARFSCMGGLQVTSTIRNCSTEIIFLSHLETVSPLYSLSKREHWQIHFSMVKCPAQYISWSQFSTFKASLWKIFVYGIYSCKKGLQSDILNIEISLKIQHRSGCA